MRSKIANCTLWTLVIASLPLAAWAGEARVTRGVLVEAGAGHAMAMRSGANLWMWGHNRRLPVALKTKKGEGLRGLTSLSATCNSVLVLREDKTVLSWHASPGSTSIYQVKDASGKKPLDDVVYVATGYGYRFAIRSDGSLWAWGENVRGCLGDGTEENRRLPVKVRGPEGKGFLSGIVMVDGGSKHSLALKKDGTVWTWGDNIYGQLGDDTEHFRPTPLQVKGLSNVVAIAAGWQHNLVMKKDGSIWSWGCNQFGQLGDGTFVNRRIPVQVKGPDGKGHLKGVKRLACGGNHSLAIGSDGALWSWGANIRGQLGDGSVKPRSAPVSVRNSSGEGVLRDVVAIDGGGALSIAVLSDGTVLAWGNNSHGQIGKGKISMWIKAGQKIDIGKMSEKKAYKSGARKYGFPVLPVEIDLPDPQVAMLLDEIAKIGADDKDKIGKLIGHLNGKESRVRIAAIRALGRIGSTTPELVAALLKISKAEAEAESMRILAINGLAMCDPSVDGVVSGMLEIVNGNKNRGIKRAAIQGIAKLGPEAKEAIPTLKVLVLKLKTKDDKKFGRSAMGALGKLRAVPDIMEFMDGPMRKFACSVLWKMGPPAAPAVPKLIKALSDEDASVRQYAASALGAIGPPAKVGISALEKTANDKNIKVRGAAIKSLKKLKTLK